MSNQFVIELTRRQCQLHISVNFNIYVLCAHTAKPTEISNREKKCFTELDENYKYSL